MSSNYIVVHPYNKGGGKSVTSKTILCNLKKKKWTFTSSQDDSTWTFALLKEPGGKKNHTKYTEQWFSRLLDTRKWWTRVHNSQKTNEAESMIALAYSLETKSRPWHSSDVEARPNFKNSLSWERARVQRSKQLEFLWQSTREERNAERTLDLQRTPSIQYTYITIYGRRYFSYFNLFKK